MESEAKKSEWGTCSNCINRDGPVCNDCPDETGEVGSTSECTPSGTCKNWKKSMG